ncbi:MAG TPA: membrane-bound lytic murein transglycosylase MltF [Cellvibrio sp.]|nr:membrane-bound lytic murein transglycosylase MltF [Cellvibrio sp.]
MDIRMHNTAKRFSIANIFILLCLIACTGLLVRSVPPSQLEQVRAAGELRVISRNGPTTFYEGSEGLTGFEYTLLQGFAHSLGVKLVINSEQQSNSVYPKINSNTFDIVSASLAAKISAGEHLRFASPYMEITQQLIFNTRQAAPSNLAELVGKNILVLAQSPQLAHLHSLQKQLPGLQYTEVEGLEMTDLLDMVEQGKADYAVVDSAIYTLYRYSYPHTQLGLNLTLGQPVAWAMAESQDNSLYDAAQAYLARIRQDGTLAQVTARFFEQMEEVTTDDTVRFAIEMERRLPHWEQDIKAAANTYGLEWQLLAAIGYQESHWDPKAESVTGVRGFMMLTNNTARELGVRNRENPTESIHGGAKYIKYLQGRLSDKVQGDDRLYMVLAAYNLGLGHLEDARILTEKKGGNPNLWEDVSKYFPLLSKYQYYIEAKHGYARGWEPVTYVENVINYQKILTRHEKHEQFRMATLNNSADETVNPMQLKPSAVEKLSRNNLDNSSSLSIL